MRFFHTDLLLIGLLLSFAVVGSSQAEEPPRGEKDLSAPVDAAFLVRQLGEELFTKRELAAQQLVKIGMPVRAELEVGLKSPDAEIRLRCRRILTVILNDDFQQRLEQFAADLNPAVDHGLPGWHRFGSLVGTDQPARALFVEMQRAEPELLQLAHQNPFKASKYLFARCRQLQQRLDQRHRSTHQGSVGTIAALLYVSTDPNTEISQQTASILNNSCYQRHVQLTLEHHLKSKPLRAVLGAWIRRSVPSQSLHEVIVLAMKHNLTEGLIPAEDVLEGGPINRRRRDQFQYAILAIAKLGDRRHISILEHQLDDRTDVGTRTVKGVKYQIQACDIALAGLFHLAGKDPARHGFEHLQRHSDLLFHPSTLGFRDELARQAAREEWQKIRMDRATRNSASGDLP